jgi:hypothetical protein
MAAMLEVDRRRWLAHRWQRHGLSGRGAALDDLLLLGFQDSRGGGAAQSIAARTGSSGVADTITVEGPLVSMWSVRGAPHVHRLEDLDVVRDALAPTPADEGGPAYVDAVGEVAAALSAVVTGPTPKGVASHEMHARVPSLVQWCASCKVEHVPDGLFRAAGRQAQLVLGPEVQRATMLHPTPKHPRRAVGDPRRALLDAYLGVNGPTTRTLYRDWVGCSTETVTELWRGLELVRVAVDGRRNDLPEALLDELHTAPDAEGVLLVPPHDPYLRQVDRTLLVPDSARRREVWRSLSPPGALLVDGEVAGTWRYRRSDSELTLTAFQPLSKARRSAAEESIRRITDEEPTLTWS